MFYKHTNRCKAYYIFKNNENLTFTLNAGYDEKEEKNIFDFDEEIDNKIGAIIERRRKKLLNMINELLF